MKTLMGNNGTFANMGSVQIQAQPATSTAVQAQGQTQVASHPAAAGVLPVRQAQLPLPTFSITNGELTVSRLNSLTDILEGLGTPGFVFPIVSRFNTIVPTNNLTLGAGKTYDPRSTQAQVTTTTKFQPFEQATGLSQERPEIVMLTNFQPLFNKDTSTAAPKYISAFVQPGEDPFMTDAGRYIDTQFNMRVLRVANIQQSISSLKQRFQPMFHLVNTRQDQFNEALSALQDDASFLLNLVRIIEAQKSQLDLRHDLYVVNPDEITSYVTQNFSKLNQSTSPNAASSQVNQLSKVGARQTFDCVDTMLDLGYAADNVRTVYASTKIWLQLLHELKAVLQHHSLSFIDLDPSYQRNDDSPSTLLEPPITYFDVSPSLPPLPTALELINLQPAQITQTLGIIAPAYTTLYSSVFFKSEEARIAALARLLSREYRYSYALTRPQVQAALSGYYGFTVATTTANTSVFDAMIGTFGNNITDFPAKVNNSIASTAQFQGNAGSSGGVAGVLTFESKYLEGDTGTNTPGGAYLFDQILQTDGKAFNTAGIDQVSAILESQLAQFGTMIDAFNLFSTPVYQDSIKNGTWRDTAATFLNNPNDVVLNVAGQLINPTNGQAQTISTDDRLCSVYSLAQKDNSLKSLMFLYTMARISRSYSSNVPFFTANSQGDNTPLVDALIAQIVVEVDNAVPESRTAVQLLTQRKLDNGANTASLTPASITASLKAGTQVTALVEQFMTSVLSQFVSRSTAIQNSASRYSGYLDTTVMMIAFDFVIAMIAKYSNQSLVGKSSGFDTFSQGQLTYVVSQTTTNHATSFNQLLQRNTGEDNLTRQLVMTILNVLRNLGGSLKGIANYLGSQTAISKLQEVAAILGNDPNQLSMLFTEQQILLLASTVENLVTANAAISTDASGKRWSPNSDSWSDPNQEVAILDESDVPSAMRDALYGYFSIGDLATPQALNKHVLTVGIPAGFTQRLKQKINIQKQKVASLADDSNDIVSVTVYKVDMRYPDIVYRPQRFLFEMSRFPTRYSTSQWLPIPQNPTLADIVNAVPTQNFTQNPEAGTAASLASGVEYASTVVAGTDGIKGAAVAFDGPQYSFLTTQQKAEILHNHVASQLVETYIELMTGINVSEYNFHMVEPPAPVGSGFVRSLTQYAMAHVSDLALANNATQSSAASSPSAGNNTGGVLFSTTSGQPLPTVPSKYGSLATTRPVLSNPAGVAGSVSPAALFRSVQTPNPATLTVEQMDSLVAAPITSLNSISHRNVPVVSTSLQTISGFANTLSSLSDADALNRTVVTPKMFDRVFNVILDSRDFDIDVTRTIATPFGQAALNLLITAGEIVPNETDVPSSVASRLGLTTLAPNGGSLGRSFAQGRAPDNVNNYRFRDLDVTAGDLVADKYIITIETLEENG